MMTASSIVKLNDLPSIVGRYLEDRTQANVQRYVIPLRTALINLYMGRLECKEDARRIINRIPGIGLWQCDEMFDMCYDYVCSVFNGLRNQMDKDIAHVDVKNDEFILIWEDSTPVISPEEELFALIQREIEDGKHYSPQIRNIINKRIAE